jgi:phage portal protein BeeE
VSRLASLLRPQVKGTYGGGGWSGVNAFSTAYDSVWSQWSSGTKESVGSSFESYVGNAYQANAVVFACSLARAMPFSEARFQFQRLEKGRPADLFGTDALDVLETPWPNGSTGELLFRMEQDTTCAGNFFATRVDGRLRRLRPDWVTIVSGVLGDPDASSWEIPAEPLGYIYEPKGVGRRVEPVFLSVDQVVHWSPITDPAAQWRGMSWLTPIVREIEADSAATKHKLNFFRNGATLGMVIKYPATTTPDDVKRYKALFDQGHAGVDKAYSALHLGGGADTTVMGVDLKQLEFRATQGAGETRIAAAAGVGAIIGRLSEGMQGSSLNAGNYQAAARQFADMTLRPLWRSASVALSKLVAVPPGSRLWYDARDVALLHDSNTDESEVLAKNAQSLRTLLDAGFNPDAAIRAVDTGDISLLTGTHSGLFSVQLQPPGSGENSESDAGLTGPLERTP